MKSETVTSSLFHVEIQKLQLWVDDVSKKVLNEDITKNVMQLKTYCVVSMGIFIPVGCIPSSLYTHTLSLYV